MKRLCFKNRWVKYLFFILVEIIILNLCWGVAAYDWKNKYDKENFNCTHMSEKLGKCFKKLGVPVEKVSGEAKDGSRHMWLRLWGWFDFESTTLFPKTNDKYKVYKIEDL